ncbi:MAG: STN domain-containing protein [Phycisphaerales bacterium]|nr:STN domain-containing protein [Phycisphaerales bacterium]
MHLRKQLITWLASLIAVSIGVSTAVAQLPRDLIEQALDQPLESLEIEAGPVLKTLETLGEKTGLRFVMEPPVVDLMPYGEQTSVGVTIRNASVRNGLAQVFDGLGLQTEIVGDRVLVVPSPMLARLGRRLTIEEVNLLGKLSQGPLSGRDLPIEIRIDPQSKPRERFDAAVAQIAAGNAVRQLESVATTMAWSWHVDGAAVVIERRQDEFRRRLDWPVDLSYQRAPLDRVLVDLGLKIGVTMLFEPGSLKAIDARDRAVDLIQRGISVRQTLERLCGNTGLRYEVTDDGVKITRPTSGDAIPGGRADQIRVSVEVRPGVTVDGYIRAESLPEELRAEWNRRVRELLGGQASPAAMPALVEPERVGGQP